MNERVLQKMDRHLRLLLSICFVCTLCLLAVPHRAEAASYWLGNPAYKGSGDFLGASQIGSKYFYRQTSGNKTKLYVAGKRTSKGKAFHTVKSYDTGYEVFTDPLLSNGKYAIYSVKKVTYQQYSADKTTMTVYRTNLSTGKKQKLFEKSGEDLDLKTTMNVSVCAVYGDTLYYIIGGSGNYTLEGYSFKKKKTSKILKDFRFIEGDGHSRYMYGRKYKKNNSAINIFDCKKNKVVRTIKNAGLWGQRRNKLYYSVNDVIYSCNLDGKKQKVVFRETSDQYISLVGNTKIYYSQYEENEYGRRTEKYYTYNMKTKKTTEIKNLGKHVYWSMYVGEQERKEGIHKFE